MKKVISIVFLFFILLQVNAQDYTYPMPAYTPTAENMKNREEFQDMKFGLFIHWGVYSVLGDGEWVMFNQKIPHNTYKRLADFFNPQQYSAKEWVQIAKAAGMKYITVTTRHHDGFSMFKTAASPYNIIEASPYGKDPMKELAEECKKEGIRLNFYYSLLDWGRDDYGFNAKIVDGAPENTDWQSYIDFMKAQLTELLTNYGEIGAIWFDGHWQRKNANWHYDEIYSLIHRLSPNTMIGNNHHLTPIPGEDFQMFERDLPGENKGGFSHGVKISQLPLESCETMNKAWGFNLNDRNFKTTKQVVHYLVNAAGRNANLLLNVGPMPNGKIQSEFADTLKQVGTWTAKYGETVYGTRGKVVDPQNWGVLTQKGNVLYVHVLNQTREPYIFIPELMHKVISANAFDGNQKVKFKQVPEGLFIYTDQLPENSVDQIIVLTIKI